MATTLNYDTRVTILGHVQRGGRPSAFDAILVTLQYYISSISTFYMGFGIATCGCKSVVISFPGRVS